MPNEKKFRKKVDGSICRTIKNGRTTPPNESRKPSRISRQGWDIDDYL
jgi:hypothetical protein